MSGDTDTIYSKTFSVIKKKEIKRTKMFVVETELEPGYRDILYTNILYT